MFVCTYTYMYIWVYTGEVNAKRVRERYLKAVLRQDIAFFDNVGAGEVATRIQTDTRTRSFLVSIFPANHIAHRFGSTRNFRKSRIDCLLLGCFLLRFHPCLCSILAACPCAVLNVPLYCDHRWYHEQIHLRVHAVSLPALFHF